MEDIYVPEKWKGYFKPYRIICKLFNRENPKIVDNTLLGHKKAFEQNFVTANQIYRGITKQGRIPYYW